MASKVKDTRWGLPLRDWDVARAQAREELLARARARATVTYSDLCGAITVAPFRPYSWALMALLDEVCREEDRVHGAMLASLVVRRDTGRPGDGYFAWAERSGLDVGDRESFWLGQAARVWDSYASSETHGAARRRPGVSY